MVARGGRASSLTVVVWLCQTSVSRREQRNARVDPCQTAEARSPKGIRHGSETCRASSERRVRRPHPPADDIAAALDSSPISWPKSRGRCQKAFHHRQPLLIHLVVLLDRSGAAAVGPSRLGQPAPPCRALEMLRDGRLREIQLVSQLPRRCLTPNRRPIICKKHLSQDEKLLDEPRKNTLAIQR